MILDAPFMLAGISPESTSAAMATAVDVDAREWVFVALAVSSARGITLPEYGTESTTSEQISWAYTSATRAIPLVFSRVRLLPPPDRESERMYRSRVPYRRLRRVSFGYAVSTFQSLSTVRVMRVGHGSNYEFLSKSLVNRIQLQANTPWAKNSCIIGLIKEP